MDSILTTDITVKYSEYRPCIVNEKKALFHRWEDISQIVPPSPMVGGHHGGENKSVAGIVEFEDGTIREVYPYNIRFVDNPFAEIGFPPEANIVKVEKKKERKTFFEETRFDCPFCNTTDGAIICGDAARKEYFAYCQKCEIETIESFRTPKAAVSAFKNGKTEKIMKEAKL